VTDDLRDENTASEEAVNGWYDILARILSDVQEGDTIVSLYRPDQDTSPLLHNDAVILRTSDRTFIKAFFDIWLGPKADPDLREQLLKKL
jgi:hypothetical protein